MANGESKTGKAIVEQQLAMIGYVVLIALFVLAPPPKTPLVLLLALLLALLFALQWAWEWSRGDLRKFGIASAVILVFLVVLGLTGWPTPRLHMSSEQVIQNPGGRGTIGVYFAFTNEGNDAKWNPYGAAVLLPPIYDVQRTAALFAKCVRLFVRGQPRFIDIPAEGGQGSGLVAPHRMKDDFASVRAGKEVMYYAGAAAAWSDLAKRTFPFCGIVINGGILRCVELPDIPEPASSKCLFDPWGSLSGPAPKPVPAPNP